MNKNLREAMGWPLALVVSACSLNPHPMILLVHPTTGQLVRCEREAPQLGWAWGIGGEVAVERCAKEYQNLGYLRSDQLTEAQRTSMERTQKAEAQLRKYWREELRPAVLSGALTAVEATERLNTKEREYFREDAFLERLQHYRLALARLVDRKILTPQDAERYEAEARLTGKFPQVPPESPSSTPETPPAKRELRF